VLDGHILDKFVTIGCKIKFHSTFE